MVVLEVRRGHCVVWKGDYIRQGWVGRSTLLLRQLFGGYVVPNALDVMLVGRSVGLAARRRVVMDGAVEDSAC